MDESLRHSNQIILLTTRNFGYLATVFTYAPSVQSRGGSHVSTCPEEYPYLLRVERGICEGHVQGEAEENLQYDGILRQLT